MSQLLTAASLVAVCIVLLAWAAQRRLIYFPLDEVTTPGQLGLERVEEVTFGTTDGLLLRGWFLGLDERPPRPTVIVFNGNAGNRAYRAGLGSSLRARGLQVLLFDYRGYGGNDGRPTEIGLREDARAARRYVLSRDDVDPGAVVYFGESLGSAVAAELAAAYSPAALVLRSPFGSLVDLGRLHYPFLPVQALLRDRFATVDVIEQVTAPVLVVAGTRDRIVPFTESQRLYDAIRAPKTLVTVVADHNDEALLTGEAMLTAVTRLVAGVSAGR